MRTISDPLGRARLPWSLWCRVVGHGLEHTEYGRPNCGRCMAIFVVEPECCDCGRRIEEDGGIWVGPGAWLWAVQDGWGFLKGSCCKEEKR